MAKAKEVKAKQAPKVEKKTTKEVPVKKLVVKKVSEPPIEELPTHGIDPVVEVPVLPEVVNLEGGMVELIHTDGSKELITSNEVEAKLKEIAEATPTNPIKQTFRSKEEADLEAHYMGLGQIEYYNTHIKGK